MMIGWELRLFDRAGDEWDYVSIVISTVEATSIAAIEVDLNSPAQYKADVSALALEANVQTNAAAALTSYDPPTKTELDSAVSALALEATVDALNDPTDAAIADAVWNEATADHVATGSFGKWVTDLITSLKAWVTTAATAIANSVSSSGTITMVRGDTFNETITLTGVITGYTKLWLTIKAAKGIADDGSALQIAFGTGVDAPGLVYLNGAAYATPSIATMTAVEATPSVTPNIPASITAQLTPSANHVYDVQALLSDGSVSTVGTGACVITGDVTRATS